MNMIRGLRRLSLVAAGVTGLMTVAAPMHSAHAEATADIVNNRPANWGTTADATGVFETVDRRSGLSAVGTPVFGRFPDGLGTFGSDPSSLVARASVYFPGLLLNNPDALYNQTGFPGTLPSNPLSTTANAGSPNAQVSTPLSAAAAIPLGLGVGNAVAHVQVTNNVPLAVTTDATLGTFDAPAVSGGLVHVGNIETHTSQTLAAHHTIITQAVSDLGDVNILGGAIHIDSIRTVSTITDTGNGKPQRSDTFTLNGVTAEGHKATIDSHGVTIDGSSSGSAPTQAAQKTLSNALAATGLRIQLIGHVPPTEALLNDAACGAGEEEGIGITQNIDLTNAFPQSIGSQVINLPQQPIAPLDEVYPSSIDLNEFEDIYFLHVVLGGACTDSQVSSQIAGAGQNLQNLSSGGGPSSPAGQGGLPGSTNPTSSSGPVGLSTNGVVGSTVASSSTPPPSTPGVGPVSPERPSLVRSIGDELSTKLVAHRVRLLYLVFTLLFLGLFVGLHWLVPARLPEGP